MARKGSEAPTCRDHPAVGAVARCASCNRGLCDVCFAFLVQTRPACARCAYEAATRSKRRTSLAVVFLSFVVGLGLWATRRYGLWPEQAASLALAGSLALIVAGLLAASARAGSSPEVVRRDVEDDAPIEAMLEDGANPYRAGARRIILAVSPNVSGKATALVVLLSLGASAVLLPASVRLPRWVEAELVLGLWWAILLFTLAVLLYKGFRLKDDLVYFTPWDRPVGPTGEAAKAERARAGGGSVLDGCSGAGLDGCSMDGEAALVALVVVVGLVVALGAAWIMVEIAMPLLFFAMYSVLMRAIRRAARDRRGCAGDLGKSLATSALWATIYILPVGALTWIVHTAHR